MTEYDRTYVIAPGDTDPSLVRRSRRPEPELPLTSGHLRDGRRLRWRPLAGAPGDSADRPAHPALFLAAAYFLGPLSVLIVRRGPGLRFWRAVAPAAVACAILAAASWWLGADLLGRGDRTVAVQAIAGLVAATTWLAVWCAGLALAARACGDEPWSPAVGQRRARGAVLGFLAPGLGLLIGGRPWRAILAVVACGFALACGLAATRFGTWWAWHTGSAGRDLSDAQLERAFLACAALAAVGLLVWLLSALDGIRLAAGPRGGRRVTGGNRVALALLVALIGLAFFFRPGLAARELDGFTGRLAADGFRAAPLLTARAAAALAPGEPVYQARLMERLAALGRTREAADLRARLDARWKRYASLVGVAAPDTLRVAAAPGP